MALITSVSVYAINGITFTPPITVGVKNNLIKRVMPVRDSSNNWIAKEGTSFPATVKNGIYSCIEVEKDESGTSYDNFYCNRSVSSMITAINT